MRRPRSILMGWDGAVFKPLSSFLPYCNREFTVGEVYCMAPVEERSMASHNAFFAAVHEGFQNLNEESAKHFPTENHLRKWSLVQTGYCSETNYACKNAAEARKLAIDLRKRDDYLIIKLHGDVVQVFEAESQNMSNMKKEIFEKSKRDVLDLIGSMARTSRPQLMKEGRHHGR